MDAKELLLRSLNQSQEYLTKYGLDGLTQEEVAWSLGPECNSIAFILWHIARVEDIFVRRHCQRKEELYEAEGWWEKLGTPARETGYGYRESGYGYTVEQLQAWPVPKLETLRGYADSVRNHTLAFLERLSSEKLDEMPWPDRPLDSIGAALCHMSTEIALHVGQITYLRGMQRGLNK